MFKSYKIIKNLVRRLSKRCDINTQVGFILSVDIKLCLRQNPLYRAADY